jgi:signal transduction histidine kinase
MPHDFPGRPRWIISTGDRPAYRDPVGTDLRRLETVGRDLVANVSHELRTPVSGLNATASRPGAEAMAQLRPGVNHWPLTKSRLSRDIRRFASP